jgi:Leucine-rich repeat (LRR) protein
MCRLAMFAVFLALLPFTSAAGQAKKPNPQQVIAAEKALIEFGCKLHRDTKAAGNPCDLVWFPKKTADRELARLVRHVGLLGTVKMIDLGETEVTDLGMKDLGKLPDLESVYLDRTAVTDAGLKELTGLPRLAWLDLIGTRVTAKSADTLASMKALSHLFLGVKIDTADVAKLSGLNRLQSLGLAPRSADEAMKEISKLTDLKELRLASAPTGPGYAELARLTSLEKLQLRGGPGDIPADGWKILADLPKLRSLDLSVHAQDDWEAQRRWVDAKREKKLAPWPAAADALASLTALRALDLTGVPIDDSALKVIGKLNGLEELCLTCTGVSLEGTPDALSGLTKLRTLKVRNARVTNTGLRSLEKLKSLELIWLYDNSISEDGVARLQKALPRCSIWWKYGKAGDNHSFRVPGGYGG